MTRSENVCRFECMDNVQATETTLMDRRLWCRDKRNRDLWSPDQPMRLFRMDRTEWRLTDEEVESSLKKSIRLWWQKEDSSTLIFMGVGTCIPPFLRFVDGHIQS